MVRTCHRFLNLFLLAICCQSLVTAQETVTQNPDTAQDGDSQKLSDYQLFPDSVQASVWIPDSNDLINRWHRTALHQLSNDPKLRPFFVEQQELIQKRLLDAGWRLGVQPQELSKYLQGQLSVAWLERPIELKPFALILMADVDDDAQTNKQMFEDIDLALSKHNPGKKELKHREQTIVQYTMPKRPGQLLAESTFLSVVSGKLIVSDELQLVQDLISKLNGEAVQGKSLAEDADFIASRQQLNVSGKGQIEYFVRPLGIARVIRAISGKRSKSDADILAVLKNQGFTAVKCIAGEVIFAEADCDIAHRGFVLADFPLPRSAAILDFPNEAMSEPPNFVTNRAASFLATSWNAKTAFWKARELVDELVGSEGVFDEVINGIKNDVNGPQVDIRNELLPLMTNDIVAVSDCQEGEVQVNSRRNLIGVKVNQSAKAAQILDRVMKAEANAELTSFEGVDIWKVTNAQNSEDAEEFSEFGDFEEEAEESEEEPWLNQWAICVLKSSDPGNAEGYFLFASHSELLEEAIMQAKSDGASGLATAQDYQRIRAAVVKLMNSENPCAWKISRNNLALRVQYELFRQGKLDQSESMMANILNRLMGSEEGADGTQEKAFSGESLPPFESISGFLNPSGFKIRGTDKGWEFGGMMLSAQKESSTELGSDHEGGTARVGDTVGEPKR